MKTVDQNKESQELVKVFSTILDKKIRENVKNSPIWDKCIHWKDITNEDKKDGGYLYTMYFKGLTPIGVTSVMKIESSGSKLN